MTRSSSIGDASNTAPRGRPWGKSEARRGSPVEQQGYVFGNTWQDERRRLAALEAGWDGVTAANLEAIGVSRGWRCAEIGAGGGSIARWLANRVGMDGKIVATDLDP